MSAVAAAVADGTIQLQRLAEALAAAATAQQVLDAVVGSAPAPVRAERALVVLRSEDGAELAIVAQHGYPPTVFETWGRFPVDLDLPLARTARSGTPLFFETREALDDEFPLLATMGSAAAAALPLAVDGRTLGVLALAFDHEQVFDEPRRALELCAARQAALALERMRLRDSEGSLRERLAFLAEAGALVSSTLDRRQALARLAGLCVPRLAEWCTVDLAAETGTAERVAAAGTEPPFPAHELVLPLVARERELGTLTLARPDCAGTFGCDDVRLAEELARRAAAAVDNALLHREAERRSEAARALAYVGDGVVLTDGDGVVRYWNPAASTIAAVAEHDAVGRPLDSSRPGHAAIDAQRPATLVVQTRRGERWLAVHVVAFDGGRVYALRDVTDERALERAKSEFVATASHELRTPLAAVFGAIRTVRNPAVALGVREREQLLEIVETEARRLNGIVAQLLVAGQLDAGELTIELEPCDQAAIAREVVAAARTRAPRAIAFRVQAEPALPRLSADGARLHQVLANLVDNSIKYSPDGGEVELSLSSAGRFGEIRVRDEGLGIPSDRHDSIFEKFHRLDPALTRGVGGAGLGLYISRELVRRMGGELSVESEPGRGSTFTVELPLARR